MRNFGKRLKRAFANRSNSEIAKLLKVSDSTITNYINGRVPSAGKLIEVSRLTNCNLHWLLTGQGNTHLETNEIGKIKTIAVISEKGGAGSTTTAIFLSIVLAEKGYRVLYIGENVSDGIITFSQQYFEGIVPQERSLIEPKFDYFFHSQLSGLDIFIRRDQPFYSYLKDHLITFQKNGKMIASEYEFIIIDAGTTEKFDKLLQTNNLLELFSLNESNVILSYELNNSNEMIIEIVTDYIEIAKQNGSDIQFIGTFINKYLIKNKKSNQEKIDEIKSISKAKLLNTIIRSNYSEFGNFILNPMIKEMNTYKIYDDYSNLINEIFEKNTKFKN